MTYGIKIAKPGKSVHSTDLRDLSVDINTFSMFKLHSSQTASVTINQDEKEKSSSISHGLGYVPAFLVYYKRSDESVERLLPDIPYGVGFDFYPWAYATNSAVVVGYSFKNPYLRQTITASDYFNSYWGAEEYFQIGNQSGSGVNGAMRFTGVNVAGANTITRAKIQAYTGWKNGSTSNYIKFRTFGIDEDNTNSFNDPFSRPLTTEFEYQERTVPTNLGDYVEIDVKDMATEIKDRAGWSSGNAMGFIMLNYGSDTDCYFGDTVPAYSYLEITKSGSITVSFRVIIFKDKISD